MHWTIIGGGLQGTTIALKLKNEGLKNEALTIIDPYSSLCERFNIYTQRISMPYLRSPFVHHIHPKPFHLKQYARYHQYTSAYRPGLLAKAPEKKKPVLSRSYCNPPG